MDPELQRPGPDRPGTFVSARLPSKAEGNSRASGWPRASLLTSRVGILLLLVVVVVVAVVRIMSRLSDSNCNLAPMRQTRDKCFTISVSRVAMCSLLPCTPKQTARTTYLV